MTRSFVIGVGFALVLAAGCNQSGRAPLPALQGDKATGGSSTGTSSGSRPADTGTVQSPESGSSRAEEKSTAPGEAVD